MGHHKDQKKDDQDRPEYQIQDKHKKFEEQLALINKIKSLEKKLDERERGEWDELVF